MEDHDVDVVGGGNSAGQAAIHLSRFARSVTILVRRRASSRPCRRTSSARSTYNPRITVRPARRSSTAARTRRPPRLDHGLEDTVRTGRPRPPCRGLFLLLGADPTASGCPADRPRRNGIRPHRARRPTDRWVDGLPPESLADHRAGHLCGRRHAVRVDEAGSVRERRGRVRRAPGARLAGADELERSELDELAVPVHVADRQGRRRRQVRRMGGRARRRPWGAGAGSAAYVSPPEIPAACAWPAPSAAVPTKATATAALRPRPILRAVVSMAPRSRGALWRVCAVPLSHTRDAVCRWAQSPRAAHRVGDVMEPRGRVRSRGRRSRPPRSASDRFWLSFAFGRDTLDGELDADDGSELAGDVPVGRVGDRPRSARWPSGGGSVA